VTTPANVGLTLHCRKGRAEGVNTHTKKIMRRDL
jgi:hypothetical protein